MLTKEFKIYACGIGEVYDRTVHMTVFIVDTYYVYTKNEEKEGKIKTHMYENQREREGYELEIERPLEHDAHRWLAFNKPGHPAILKA